MIHVVISFNMDSSCFLCRVLSGIAGRVPCRRNWTSMDMHSRTQGLSSSLSSVPMQGGTLPAQGRRGSGRWDRPYPGRLRLGVERWHTFLLSSGSEPGEPTIRKGWGIWRNRACSSSQSPGNSPWGPSCRRSCSKSAATRSPCAQACFPLCARGALLLTY